MIRNSNINADNSLLNKKPSAQSCAKRKRCYDVTLSRQEGSMTRHLASAQYWAGLAGGDTGRLFLTFGGPVRADRISYCPLDRMY